MNPSNTAINGLSNLIGKEIPLRNFVKTIMAFMKNNTMKDAGSIENRGKKAKYDFGISETPVDSVSESFLQTRKIIFKNLKSLYHHSNPYNPQYICAFEQLIPRIYAENEIFVSLKNANDFSFLYNALYKHLASDKTSNNID